MNKHTVTSLNLLISTQLSLNPKLYSVSLEAEIGRITKHSSGHYYFVAKDNKSSINCVMFRNQVKAMKSDINEGDLVNIEARVGLFEKNAALQLYVQKMSKKGEGDLLLKFHELKSKLEKEGIFNIQKELKLNKYPERVALITSPTSAARKDFEKIFKRNNPFCKLELLSTTMQGETTANEIINQLEEKKDIFDIIVITRGGGSYEELSVFNNEKLARYIANYKTPIISAIGHEIDFTIAEFTSYLRAATPTDAANLCGENIINKLANLKNKFASFSNRFISGIEYKSDILDSKFNNIKFILEKILNQNTQNIDYLFDSSKANIDKLIQSRINQINMLISDIDGRSPLKILERGYSLTSYNNKKILSVKDINIDNIISTKFIDGVVFSEVKEILND